MCSPQYFKNAEKSVLLEGMTIDIYMARDQGQHFENVCYYMLSIIAMKVEIVRVVPLSLRY